MKKFLLLGGMIMLMLLHSHGIAQIKVAGTIKAANNDEALIGAYVLVKGTNTGTVTDVSGKFSLEMAAGGTLVVSYIGYVSQEIPITSSNENLAIRLEEDLGTLEEVVITGLASSVKRTNLANAVGTLSEKELTGIAPTPTIDGAMYGKITGVNITQSSGAPGGGIAMRLRGISSIVGQNQPLVVLDGVYLDNSEIPSGLRNASGANSASEEQGSNRLADLNPADIENIEVLKGPSAAAIYGARANAGVIVITTKKGSQGKTNIRFTQDVGFNSIQRKIGVREFNKAKVEEVFGPEEAEIFESAQNAGKIYDYEEEIYGQNGLILRSNLSLSGGTEKTRFYLMGSIHDEDGIIKNTGYNRKSFRMNVSHDVTDWLTISSNTNYVNSYASRGFTGNENEGGLSYGYNLAFTRPWTELHPVNGVYPDNRDFGGNMLFVIDKAHNKEFVDRIIQGFALDIDILRRENMSLKFKGNAGFDIIANKTDVYVPESHQAQRDKQNGFIGIGKNQLRSYNHQAFLVWDNYLVNKKLVLSTQAGLTYLDIDREFIYDESTQLVVNQTNLAQSGSQETKHTISFENDFGFAVQEEINYDDKIIATLGLRADKSNLNGDPNKYYFFPKASLAINIANFDFWQFSSMNMLKPRFAYGQTGSSARFGALFQSLNSTNIGGVLGLKMGNSADEPEGGIKGNRSIEPERAAEFEAGFDIGLLNGRIVFEGTYYNRNITDLIVNYTFPTSSGFRVEIINGANMQNKGIELGLGATVIQSEKWQWFSKINIWRNRSKITRLDIPSFAPSGSAFGASLGTFFIEEGQPATQLKGSVEGFDDPQKIGDVEPDFQLGFYNEVKLFKNFDLSFMLHWKQGGDNINLTTYLTDIAGLTPDLDSPSGQERLNKVGAIRFIEDASYVRLREAAIYYNVPSASLNSAFGNTVESVRIGVSARNFLTFTNYTGYDPEVSTKGGSGLSTGVDVNPFPSSKQVFFHVQVGF